MRNKARREKIKTISGVLSLLCLVVGGAFLALYFLRQPDVGEQLLPISFIYFGASVLLFGVCLLIRRRDHRRSSYPVSRGMRRQGAVLLFALVMLGAVSATVLHAQFRARANLRRERAAVEKLRTDTAALLAAHEAMRALADDEDLLTDHTNEAWAAERAYEDPSGITTRARVYDACARFDINNLSVLTTHRTARRADDMMMDILTACGDYNPVAKVDALKDWVDEDGEGVYEDRYYGQRERGYAPPNRPARTRDELLSVPGFTRSYFDDGERDDIQDILRPRPDECLAVLPVDRRAPIRVNVNTAPRAVLIGCFGLEREQVVRYILYMRTVRPLQDLSALADMLTPAEIESAERMLDVKSSFYRIETESFSADAFSRVTALVQRDRDGTVSVMRWAMQ